MMLSVTPAMWDETIRWQWIMNWEGYRRKWLWRNLRYHYAVCMDGQSNTTKNSFRMISAQAEIWVCWIQVITIIPWTKLHGLYLMVKKYIWIIKYYNDRMGVKINYIGLEGCCQEWLNRIGLKFFSILVICMCNTIYFKHCICETVS
jgi:hypothetical protein